MQPGDVALVDSTRPMDFVFGGHHSQQISLHLPREEMRSRFGPRIESGLGLLPQEALGLAMRAILAKMLEPAHQESSHLKDAFLGVLGSMFCLRPSFAIRPRLGVPACADERRSLSTGDGLVARFGVIGSKCFSTSLRYWYGSSPLPTQEIRLVGELLPHRWQSTAVAVEAVLQDVDRITRGGYQDSARTGELMAAVEVARQQCERWDLCDAAPDCNRSAHLRR